MRCVGTMNEVSVWGTTMGNVWGMRRMSPDMTGAHVMINVPLYDERTRSNEQKFGDMLDRVSSLYITSHVYHTLQACPASHYRPALHPASPTSATRQARLCSHHPAPIMTHPRYCDNVHHLRQSSAVRECLSRIGHTLTPAGSSRISKASCPS